jgi:chloramphenicol 3-O phosphotransferase
MSTSTGDRATNARDAGEPTTIQVIVLNGGSSSGKSGLARCLQAILPDPWLTFGVDTLIHAMPPALTISRAGIDISRDGEVFVGPVFHALEYTWMAGIAAMARAGGRIIADEVFLGGAASQQRWREALAGLGVLWVGVRCEGDVAAGREAARADRVPGQARAQADLVHRGVSYDLEVNTAGTESMECARIIAARVARTARPGGAG